jgi:hypothetical protein
MYDALEVPARLACENQGEAFQALKKSSHSSVEDFSLYRESV